MCPVVEARVAGRGCVPHLPRTRKPIASRNLLPPDRSPPRRLASTKLLPRAFLTLAKHQEPLSQHTHGRPSQHRLWVKSPERCPSVSTLLPRGQMESTRLQVGAPSPLCLRARGTREGRPRGSTGEDTSRPRRRPRTLAHCRIGMRLPLASLLRRRKAHRGGSRGLLDGAYSGLLGHYFSHGVLPSLRFTCLSAAPIPSLRFFDARRARRTRERGDEWRGTRVKTGARSCEICTTTHAERRLGAHSNPMMA